MNDLPKTEIPENEDTLVEENSNVDKGLSTESEDELDEKTKTGFQRLVAKKDQTIQETKSQLDEANRKLEAYEAAKRQQELDEMTEAEKLKAERDDFARKYAQAELKSFVTSELTKRNLMSLPIAGSIINRPWLLDCVAEHLSTQPTWDETIAAVKEFLPAYLDTLVVPADNNATPIEDDNPTPVDETPTNPMPSERGEPVVTPGDKRTWTKQEIAEIQKDSLKWLKYRDAITQAYNEGRVV